MRKSPGLRFATVSLALATLTLSAWALEAQPVQIVGEFESSTLASQHPYPAGSPQNPSVTTYTVHYPGATYIKVHFSRFDLAPGDTLEIISADGSERYAFRDKGYKNMERDFWGNSVLGDTAILKLTSTGLGGYGFDLDYFTRGIVPIVPEPEPGTESVCGTQDWEDVECYATSHPTEYDRAKRAIYILSNGFALCTGVKVGCPNQFLTNEHCITSQSGVNAAEVRFEYQKTGCNTGTSPFTLSFLGDQFVKDDVILDYCLFTTQGASDSYPAAGLDPRLPPVGERIYISGHPAGGPKKLSIFSGSNPGTGGLCAVDVSPINGNGTGTDVGYLCDTTNGSSGSPVWSGVTNKVVALHHFGGCFNSGVRMDLIYPGISSLLTSCGPSTCGNGQIDAGEDCDGGLLGGLTCTDLGFTGGTLGCSSTCTFDTSACTGIPCSDVTTLQGRCNASGTLQMRILLTDSSHAGESVTFLVDGNPQGATVSGSSAKLAVTGQASGLHTIELADPAGCQAPIVVNCP